MKLTNEMVFHYAAEWHMHGRNLYELDDGDVLILNNGLEVLLSNDCHPEFLQGIGRMLGDEEVAGVLIYGNRDAYIHFLKAGGCGMTYIIQTKKPNNSRLDVSEIMSSSGGDIKDWNNYSHTFEDYDSAKKESELIIKSGQYKARNVRILKVICNFDSEIIVKASESHA